jgi:hypothetical protein
LHAGFQTLRKGREGEAGMLRNDWQFAERIQCNIEEKKEGFGLMVRLRTYATVIQQEGFPALEKERRNIDDEFVAIGKSH